MSIMCRACSTHQKSPSMLNPMICPGSASSPGPGCLRHATHLDKDDIKIRLYLENHVYINILFPDWYIHYEFAMDMQELTIIDSKWQLKVIRVNRNGHQHIHINGGFFISFIFSFHLKDHSRNNTV